jgi:hypothetical protein
VNSVVGVIRDAIGVGGGAGEYNGREIACEH